MFELRRIDDEASDSVKPSSTTQKDLLEDSKLANGQDGKFETESDGEDVDYFPKSRKLGNDRYVSKRNSPVHVYTFEVNFSDFGPRGLLLSFRFKCFS